MFKDGLVDEVSKRTGLTHKDAARALSVAFDIISEELCRQRSVHIKNFGKFIAVYRKARESTSPSTGKRYKITPFFSPAFRASATLKSRIRSKLKI